MNIHSTAIINPEAKISETAKIGAYAIIEGNVVIGNDTVIEPHARICDGSVIGNGCTIASFTTISGYPQDLHFDKGIVSYVEIGDRSVVREGSTIHKATIKDGKTKIGEDCYLMANSHIGHDVIVGDSVIIAPFTAIGGHARIGKNSFISGGVMIHQRTRVGQGAILSGNGRFSQDVPPFVIAAERNELIGLNIVGLSRRKHTREAIANIKELFAFVYSSMSIRKNAEIAKDKGLSKTPEGDEFLKFFLEVESRSFCKLENV